jgi:tetratricopeptide (TPR) repeat protein
MPLARAVALAARPRAMLAHGRALSSCSASQRVYKADVPAEQLPDVVAADECFLRGDFAGARANLERSLDIFSQMPAGADGGMAHAAKRRLVAVCEATDASAEGETLLRELRGASPEADPEPVRAAATFLAARGLARCLAARGDLSAAAAAAKDAAGLAAEAFSESGAADAAVAEELGFAGAAHGFAGDADAAQKTFRSAVAAARTADDAEAAAQGVERLKVLRQLRRHEALVLVNRGAAAWGDANARAAAGDQHAAARLDAAVEDLSTAAEAMELGDAGPDPAENRIEDGRDLAAVLCGLGHVRLVQGQPERARESLERALRAQGRLAAAAGGADPDGGAGGCRLLGWHDDDLRLALTLAHLAKLSHADEKAVTAEGLYRSALEAFERPPLGGGGSSAHPAGEPAQLHQRARAVAPPFRWAHALACEGYARLLEDWDKRAGEAEAMRTRARELADGLRPWPVLTPHVLARVWSPWA